MDDLIVGMGAGAGAVVLKSAADILTHAGKATFDGLTNSLEQVCGPAKAEIGEYLADQVRQWRRPNAEALLNEAVRMVLKRTREAVWAHPRILFEVVDKGSLASDKIVQDAWAGILASACTPEGNDDGNLIFISLLTHMTAPQVRILDYLAKHTKKYRREDTIRGEPVQMPAEVLAKVMEIEDFERIVTELEHLRTFDLLTFGSEFVSERNHFSFAHPRLAITRQGLRLYVRAQGYTGSPFDYFPDDLDMISQL